MKESKFKKDDKVTGKASMALYTILSTHYDKTTNVNKYVLETETGQLCFLDENYLDHYLPKLKPCPFCKNKNVVLVDNYREETTKKLATNVCCDATQGGCGAFSGHSDSGRIQLHIELWNNAKR